MKKLYKILKEIEKLKKMYKESSLSLIDKGNLPCEYDKSDIESAKMQAISEAITIIRKHMNDDWISVDERLPEDDRMVLVTCQTKKGIRSVNRAYCDGAFWHGSGSMSGVIAWRPLPEPYRPERSENDSKRI